MYTPVLLNSFKKDYKLADKRGLAIADLDVVLTALINGKELPLKYKNHKLKGSYKDCLECHIRPDWLLIYRVDELNNTITFIRTGSHSDLFK